MSFNLSVNSTLLLEEPLFIASVITFGIDGDCILEELMMNASIDDIYGKNIINCKAKKFCLHKMHGGGSRIGHLGQIQIPHPFQFYRN